MMEAVFILAKCMDFDNDNHRFYSFETLASLDPRTLPNMYNCGGTKIEDDIIKLARNDDMKHVSFSTWGEFKKLAYSDTCEDPVDTGLVAKYTKIKSMSATGSVKTEDKQFDQKVCVNPLCYYDPEGGKCVKK
jgi:hypothetical protein